MTEEVDAAPRLPVANIVALCASIVLCLVVLMLGLRGGDAPWGVLLLCSGGLYSTWLVVRAFWVRDVSGSRRGMQILAACLGAPVLVAVPVMLALGVASFFPPFRALVAQASRNPDSHFSGIENIVAQVFVTGLLVWLGGALIGLAAILLVALPVSALRNPVALSEGSNIERIAQRRQALVARLVYVGLSPLVLGIALWVFSGGDPIGRFPQELAWVMSALSAGQMPYHRDLGFVLGVILVVLGGATVALGCVLTVFGDKRGSSAQG